MSSNPIQYVTLVSGGGTPVRLADMRGAPYPTTGQGALVFSDAPTLIGPVTIQGGITWTEEPTGPYHSPLTNRGDLWYYGVNGDTRLPAGPPDTVLVSTGTELVWGPPTSGAVSSITVGTGLTASPNNPITSSGSINLADTAVLAGSYGDATHIATFTVDQQGRLTAAGTATVGGGSVTSLTQGTGITLTPNPITSAGTIALDTTYLSTQLGAYLPLVGGTLTGALLGTTATFSGNLRTDGLLQLGGTTTAFPGLFHTGAILEVKLADSSAFTEAQASAFAIRGTGTFRTASASSMSLAINGNVLFRDSTGTDFGRIQLGGTTSSFPAIRRSLATLNFRTADDSADIDVSFKTQSYPNNTTYGATTAYVTSAIAALPAFPASLPPSGPASGDLAGTYPGPTIKSSVILAGSPTTTTQTDGTNNTTIATTAFVTSTVSTAGAGYQPIDPELTALAGLNATPGLVEQTGAAAFTKRPMGVVAATNVLTRADGDGRYITPAQATAAYQPIDAGLTALSSASPGIIVNTAADTFSSRAITGTASRIAVTNGDGVLGNPIINIDAAYAGQASIVTVGTVATGSWNASIIAGQYGGTGIANTGKTITIGGNLATTGAFASTFAMTGTTSVTFPTTGTLATTTQLASYLPLTGGTLSGPGNLTVNGVFTISNATGSSSVPLRAGTDNTANIASTAWVRTLFATRGLGAAVYIYNSSGNAGVDPGVGKATIETTVIVPPDPNSRRFAINKTDADLVNRYLLLFLPGDSLILTDEIAPIDFYSRYDITSDPVDMGTWVQFNAVFINSQGLAPSNGARVKITGYLNTATGDGPILGVAAGAGLLGGGVAGNVQLDVDFAVVAALDSPTFTGNPNAPTAPTADNDTSIATTAFVKNQGYLTTASAVSGYQPLDSDLTAIAALSTTGIIIRTGAGTVTTRSVTGAANRITVTNGDGITANAVIDIAATYVGQTSITTLGVVTTGTWNASVIPGLYGGTGVANSGKTITLGGNLTTSGLFASTFTMTGTTTVTFPTTGTLATTTDLGSYLPLAGGTLTGPLIGTTASFTAPGASGTVVTAGEFYITGAAVGGTGSRIYLGGGGSVARSVYIEGINTGGGNNAHDMVLGTSAGSAQPAEALRLTAAKNAVFAGAASLKTTLTVFGAGGVNSGTLVHDDSTSFTLRNVSGSTLYLGASNANVAFMQTSGLFPAVTKTKQFGSATFIWNGLHSTNGVFYGATSGTITVSPPAVAGANTITWPAATGTVALTTDIPVTFPPSGTAGGDLSGTYPNPTIKPGTNTQILTTVGGVAAWAAPPSTAPSGAAGGDLAGTYPNPTVKASVGLTGAPTAPTATAGTNTTQIASTQFVNTAVAAVIGGATPAGPAGGDLSGTYPNPLLKPSVTNGQVMTTVGGVAAWTTPTAGGTVTTVSVASANGFAGTVATATTTPAITLTTTITGMLKGNATAISAAVAGTDYMTPANVSAAYQPLDAELTALAGLNATAGLVEQTGAAAFTKRLLGVAAATSVPTRADADARYAAIVHTHVSADITDFAEATDDRVAALIVGGTNITSTYNDVANTLTIAAAAYPTSLPPSGAASGDLAGTYPSPTIKSSVSLAGVPLVTTAVAVGAVANEIVTATWVNAKGYLTSAAVAAAYQPLDPDLTALAGLSASVGLLEQTGAAAFTKRAIGATNATDVLTRADGDTRYMQPADIALAYQPLDADLSALAGLTTTGIVTRTGTNLYSTRTITGTASRISVTQGDGVVGNPTINIDAAYAGQNTIVTVGTVSAGTWQGTAVAGQYGGTGVANTGKTLTLGGNLLTSGAFASNFTMTNTTAVTFPTSGTLATTTNLASYLPLTGGTLTGNTTIGVAGLFTITASATPQVTARSSVPKMAGTDNSSNIASTAWVRDLFATRGQGAAIYKYVTPANTAIDPGDGNLAVETVTVVPADPNARRLALSKIDDDLVNRYLMLFLPGDSLIITSEFTPITFYARYDITGNPVDNTTWVQMAAVFIGSQGVAPTSGTRVKITGYLNTATGDGPILGVAAGDGLLGGGASGNVELDVNFAIVAALDSPALTGNPTAPTPVPTDNDTSIATTKFVKDQGYITAATVAASYQPLDADLTALAGLNATAGLVEQTGAAAFTKRLIGVVNATDVLTRADGDGRYITPAQVLAAYQPLDSDLTAIAGLATTGILIRTGTGTMTTRSVTGATNRITVTNGDGVTANAVIDISAAYIGQSTITTLGTVATGIWNATVIAGQYGGTGVANTGKTITIGGNLTTSGAFASTFTMTGTTTVTFPTTGTLATTAQIPTSLPPNGPATGDLTGNYPAPTIKADVGLTGVPTAPTAAAATNTTQIATTAFVQSEIVADLALYLPLTGGTLSGSLTGTSARFDGGVGIGAANSTVSSLYMTKQITGSTTAYGVRHNAVVQSDVTTAAYINHTTIGTLAAAFTVGTIAHYSATQGTIGAGSAVTNQYGFYAHASLAGATNNYGFISSVATGAGSNWNFYTAGTAPNYFAGAIGHGSATLGAYNIRLSRVITGAVTAYYIYNPAIVQSDVTTSAYYNYTYMGTAAATFTLATMYGHRIEQQALGAGSAVTTQYGIYVGSSLVGATNNFGFYSVIPTGTNNWNFYAAGAAPNYFAGKSTLAGGGTSTTMAPGTNTTDIATTAFVTAAIALVPSGSVTTVSVVSANGLAGTVATPTSTPAITLSTTITGMLKGNGTAISAGVAGTDYVSPAGLTTALGSYLPLTGGTLSGALTGTTETFSGASIAANYQTSRVGNTIGGVGFTAGDATHMGYVNFNNAAGTRQGYIGYSQPIIGYVVEVTGGYHNFTTLDGPSRFTLASNRIAINSPDTLNNLTLIGSNTLGGVYTTAAATTLNFGIASSYIVGMNTTMLYPYTTKVAQLGSPSNVWNGLHSVNGIFYGSTSGTITVNPPAVAGANTITWPAATGTVALTTTAVVTISATAPGSPFDGQLWFNTDGSAGGGKLYVRYNDGNTTQWVPVA